MKKSAVLALCVLCLGAWLGPPKGALGRTGAPRLILPEVSSVRPGQLVELRWTPADSVSELEILLSEDGGRTYSECVSPRLDPTQCRFVWRLSARTSGPISLRIRYNRGGREIEGPPAALLAMGESPSGALPLGLPPASRDASNERTQGRNAYEYIQVRTDPRSKPAPGRVTEWHRAPTTIAHAPCPPSQPGPRLIALRI